MTKSADPLDTRLLRLALGAAPGSDLRRALVRAADAELLGHRVRNRNAREFDTAPIMAIRAEMLSDIKMMDATTVDVLRALDSALTYAGIESWRTTSSGTPEVA